VTETGAISHDAYFSNFFHVLGNRFSWSFWHVRNNMPS